MERGYKGSMLSRAHHLLAYILPLPLQMLLHLKGQGLLSNILPALSPPTASLPDVAPRLSRLADTHSQQYSTAAGKGCSGANLHAQ